MGIIQRQSLKSSIISYIGVGIGIVSTMVIYPKALEILGLFRSLFDASVLIGIVVMMGSSVSAVRFFPRYQDPATGHGGLLTWLLMISGAGFLIFLIAFPFLQDWMVAYIFTEDNLKYADMVVYIIPLTLLLALINLLSRYISNFRLITVPAALEQLSIKISLPLIVLAYLQGWLTVEGVVICIVLSFAFAAFGMVYYLMHLGELKLARPLIIKDKPALKEYSWYAWYGILSGVGSQVAFRIDGLMVFTMIKSEAAGVYAISWALSDIIIKPMRMLGNIAGPMLAQKIEDNKIDEVKTIYQKSSLNMTIIGIGLFFLIWTVLPYIFNLMSNPEVMRQGTYVVFFLGLAQVFDMMTGVNGEIISYSKYYRFTLYLTLFLAGTNILANYLLIPMYGLAGSALATCLSMFLFNVIKLAFIKLKFGFQPFTSRHLPVIAFVLGAWLISRALPEADANVINLFYKSAVFTTLYGGAIWWFHISPDINHWVDLGWKKGLSLLGKGKS
ncbi:MAG: polysaccharide biosynthesis C-terminal domain-containing protein [Saprospiraceae bacterium]|nr:polysaccharide biosynthesis C-terminal domain-containing protein [Candidatus Opimibacter iunctus]